MRIRICLLLLNGLFLIQLACREKLSTSAVVYENNFEDGTVGIVGEKLDTTHFNGSMVLGNLHNETISLSLDDLPDHEYITVLFDLYIHDSWDGNQGSVDGPDLWTFEAKTFENKFRSTDLIFVTSFSNSPCVSAHCLDQSFPNVFPFPNLPRTETSANLPGFCELSASSQGTSLYQMERTFKHQASNLFLSFTGDLNQMNVEDPRCNESWSLDNLTIIILN